jgi:hypothetical protein
MSEDRFLQRLRDDARPLRYEPDERTLARIRARIRETLEPEPTVAELLAGWFRPLATAFVTIVLVAVIGAASLLDTDAPRLGENPVEISMAGDIYRVAN